MAEEKKELYFLKYDYLSLREEMRENLKYQKELGWACIATVVAFLGTVLGMKKAIPELCLVPLPVLLFCSAKVKELKRSNIRILGYMHKKVNDIKDNPYDTELWEEYLYETRQGKNQEAQSTIWNKIKSFLFRFINLIVALIKEIGTGENCRSFISWLATSEYVIMALLCLLIYAMKTVHNNEVINWIYQLRGSGMVKIGIVFVVLIWLVSRRYWRISGEDLKNTYPVENKQT